MNSAKEDYVYRQAFPTLTESQLALLMPLGDVRPTVAGEVLFEVGDAAYHLVVVLEGRTEVIDRSDGVDRVLKASGPGEFHGELGLLTGQTVFAACVVREPGAVLMVPPAALRDVLRTIPELADVLVMSFAARRKILMRSAAATLTIIGPEASGHVLHLREFAERNRIPHRWLEPDDPAARALLGEEGGAGTSAVRVVVRGRQVLADPTTVDIACALGLNIAVRQETTADLLVVGTGPAGLAAAVYGASEGLSTLAIQDMAIGGQAGSSSRIENYLGFPTGISGGDLAFLAEVQALKFGAQVVVPHQATGLRRAGELFEVELDHYKTVRARSVVIATGASYRQLGLPEQARFDGASIFYAATELEARRCQNREVVVVGAGNSAGQAAMFLAGVAQRVHLVCRGPNLARSMSYYLIERLEHTANVIIHIECTVGALHGDERLEAVTVNRAAADAQRVAADAVFVMIGADPCTGWLQGTVALDDKCFVLTGADIAGNLPGPITSPFQTSEPGVFAVGDVRSGSVKRVASAVGEGSVVVQAVHRYLTERDRVSV